MSREPKPFGRPRKIAEGWTDERRGWLDEGLPVIARVACRYAGKGLPFEDLLASGRVGLVEAALRYDPSRGASFATYATWWIRKMMIEALCTQSLAVTPSRYRLLQQRRLQESGEDVSRDGEEPCIEQLAERSGMSRRSAERALEARVRMVSLDEPEEETGRTAGERLAESRQDDPMVAAMRRQGVARVRRLLRRLPERDRAIISCRYGLDGEEPLSRARIGALIGLSRERVRQIELSCLRWLRRRLRAQRRGRRSG